MGWSGSVRCLTRYLRVEGFELKKTMGNLKSKEVRTEDGGERNGRPSQTSTQKPSRIAGPPFCQQPVDVSGRSVATRGLSPSKYLWAACDASRVSYTAPYRGFVERRVLRVDDPRDVSFVNHRGPEGAVERNSRSPYHSRSRVRECETLLWLLLAEEPRRDKECRLSAGAFLLSSFHL